MALINLRNALMAGKRLPYDAEVEYLESTGTQYINTGVILDSTYGIDILFAPMETSNVSEHGIFGSSVSGTGSVHNVLQIHSSAGGVGLWMPSGTRVASAAITVGTIQRWQININNNGDVIVDGVDKGDSHPTTASACPYPVYLFARDVGGAIKSGSYSKMRLYSWTVTDASGNIIQQLIPVRKGTVGYLYDRVSGRLFGNAGTGDFVLGPDVVPVEYIESHGTEWIDTGYKASNSTRAVATFERTGGNTSSWIFGARDGTSAAVDKFALFCGIDSNTGYAMIGSAAGQFSSAAIKNGKHTLEMSLVGGVVVDSQVVATYSASEQSEIFSAAHVMVLFNLWNGSSLYNYFIGRFFSFKIYESSVLVRDHIPVRVGTEGAMMDTLTRRIYRNAGTGAFSYGNDLKYPIPA